MPTWEFEPGHTSATFAVRHMMITIVRGHFKNLKGKFHFDPAHPKYLNVPLEFDNVDPGAATIEGGRLAFHLADDIVVTLERTNGA